MAKKIKNHHVLVLGSGPSIKKYKEKIHQFIKDNDIVTFGCNNIMGYLVPDYHFWGSLRRWKEFGDKVDPSTVIVTSKHFPAKVIRKKWKGSYVTFSNVERMWKYDSDKPGTKECKRCQIDYINGKMFGCVRNIATWAIFYAYVKGASAISVVGNDGYTLYSKQDLQAGKHAQHCYGEGMTDGYTYTYCRKKDWDKYKTLRLLHKFGKKKYGFGFKIITPTIYADFYDSNILNIEPDPDCQVWEEPKESEYKNLYFKCLKDKKLTVKE